MDWNLFLILYFENVNIIQTKIETRNRNSSRGELAPRKSAKTLIKQAFREIPFRGFPVRTPCKQKLKHH